MFMQLLVIFALALSCVNAQDSNVTIDDVVQAFNTAKIVPDVLPVFEPIGLLDVVFTQPSDPPVNVTPGLQLARNQTALRPQVSFTTNMTTFVAQTFVLAMVDPDAPTPQNPNVSQIRHLLAPDLTLNGSSAGGAVLVNNTPAISDFLQPTPPSGSDPHRYILLLFVQPGDFDSVASNFVNASTPVSDFNISEFAEQTGLGNPIAGNFFLVGPDLANATDSNTTTTTDTSVSGATSAAGSAPGPASSGPDTSQTTPAGGAGGNSALGLELNMVGVSCALGLLGMLML